MASIKSTTRKDGSVAHRVVWRTGGARDGAWDGQTFASLKKAQQFKAHVEAAGHQLPAGWIRGLGYVQQLAEPASATSTLVDSAPVPCETAAPAALAAPEDLLADFGIAHIEQLTGVAPDTRHRYSRQIDALDRELSALTGRTPTVQGLTDQDVRRWVNWRAEQHHGSSPKTISNYHGLLYAVMQTAIQRGLRASNPCAGTRLPARGSGLDADLAENVFLTEQQFALLAECMFPADPERLGAGDAQPVHAGSRMDRWLVEAAVATGMRWGELSALQVRDLALTTGPGRTPTARVRRAWKRNPPAGSAYHRDGVGQYYLGGPKTRKGRRVVTLSAHAALVLRQASVGKAGEDFVFTAPQGGPLLQATWYEDRWKRAVALAVARGLPVAPRFHDLRHTHAAWLISAGVPLSVIQQRLGHESIQITNDVYGGLLPQAHQAADAAIDAALAGRDIDLPGGALRSA